MGCCLPSRVGAAGHGYTPINEPGASGTATLRAGRWSPISYGKKTWALAADGTLSRPAAYVHPVLWQMMADAEQDDKAWKKQARRSGSALPPGVRADGDDGWEAEEDYTPVTQGQQDWPAGPQPAPRALSLASVVPSSEVSTAEAAPLLPTLTPSARGAAAIARAAELQRATAASTALPPSAAVAQSKEQLAAEEAFAKKDARKRAKKQKKRDTAAASEHAETSSLLQLQAQTPDAETSAPMPPSSPPPKSAAQQAAGFEDTNWGTVDVGLLPENWTAHRDPTTRSFYYFNERTLKVRWERPRWEDGDGDASAPLSKLASAANREVENTFDPKQGTMPDLPPAAGLSDRSVRDSPMVNEIDHVMGVIAMEEHAASDIAVGPHSKALFGIGPAGLDLPPVETTAPRDRGGAAGRVGARVGPGRAPLTVGDEGDSDLDEWSDDDH